ncbi:MAG: SGNH/GDSL hydrolase family protein [Acidimicrobiales bacterium]
MTLLTVVLACAFSSCAGPETQHATTTTAIGPAPSLVAESFDECPDPRPLPFTPTARRDVRATVRRAVAVLYRKIDTAGWRIATLDPATSAAVGSYGGLVGSSCGRVTRQRTYIAELDFPAMPGVAASQSSLYVSRLAPGWQVWGEYPPGVQTTIAPNSLPTTVPTTVPEGATRDSTPQASSSGPIYLALGDSAPMWDGNKSYPDYVAGYYAGAVPGLELVNLAQSGATTASMLGGPAGGAGSQQAEAVAYLRAHHGSIALVTIDIGGNDILGCVTGGATAESACIARTETTMIANLATILDGLRQAAGSALPIVGMTYYDPFIGNWLGGGNDRTTAVQSVSTLVHLNDLLKEAYARVGAKVADVQGAFQSTDLSTTVGSPWGRVPVAVERGCTLLDITCEAGHAEAFGDDPNTDGAAVIAKAFEKTIATLDAPR